METTLFERHECGIHARPQQGDYVVTYCTDKSLLWWAAFSHEADARHLEAAMRSSIVSDAVCHPEGTQWCAHCSEADIGLIEDEPVEKDEFGSPIGIWKRYTAGIQSLVARADINLKVTGLGIPQECSHYGDTDQRFRFTIGEEAPTEDIERLPLVRYAVLEGELVLHRTVGRRTEWLIEMGWLTVWSRHDDSQSVFSFSQGCGIPHHHLTEKILIERIISELAARSLEIAAQHRHMEK